MQPAREWFPRRIGHLAGVMQPLDGITAEMVEPQDWHAVRIM